VKNSGQWRVISGQKKGVHQLADAIMFVGSGIGFPKPIV